MDRPSSIDNKYRFDNFFNDECMPYKINGRLPAMGWNSWNAFGSGNNEELTRAMAQKIKELELDKFGYKYIVLDDGCYNNQRIDGKLCNNPEKFPSGFRALADYIHSLDLKFGMYNDIGTRLCSGLEVGTHGHEALDAESYLEWDIDFIKVDNCYYMWDNATFADPENARYTFAPNIKAIRIDGEEIPLSSVMITGPVARIEDDHITFIGTYDGTAPDHSPVGDRSSEVRLVVSSSEDRKASVSITYSTGKEEGKGEWLQLAVDDKVFYDDLLPESDDYIDSENIEVELKEGNNVLRIMNHRRQENTLRSYAALMEQLDIQGGKDILLSCCEWGKTQPQHWGYKVGNSWRILNDITFAVGSAEGDFGTAAWDGDYTTNITAQYNKAVIMDEFAGLDKGWNDPDMLVIGMNGIDLTMNRSHMAMWCMLNSPLFLGLDLRRVAKGDELYKIITNKDLIDLNQDALGIQAKRIFTTKKCDDPSKEYIREIDRIDVLVKPLSDGSIAVGIFNIDKNDREDEISISLDDIRKMIKLDESFVRSGSFMFTDLWTKESEVRSSMTINVKGMKACDNIVYKVTPV